MRILRWLLGFTITIVLLLIVAIIVLPKVFNPNDYREQISSLVKEKTQRDLTIEGDLQLSVFPWLGVTTGRLTLSQPNHLSDDFGGGNMLEVDAANIRLKIMPLLTSLTKDKKDIQVDTIVLKQPNIELITTKAGVSSLDGLSGDETAEQTTQDEELATKAGAALIVQGVDIESARLVWDDRQTDQRYELRELNVNTGNLLSNDLADLVASGELLDSSTPDVLQFDLNGKAQIDVELFAAKVQELELKIERGDLNANLRIGAVDFAHNALIVVKKIVGNVAMENEEIGSLKMDSSIPDLVFDQSFQTLQLTSLSAQGEFQGRGVVVSGQDIRADLNKQIASISTLLSELDGVSVAVSQLTAQSIIDDPKFQARVDVQPFNARRLIKSFGIDFEPSEKKALTNVGVSTDITGSLNAARLDNLQVLIDESSLTGFVAVNDYANPNIKLDLALDKFNVDQYLPESEETQTADAGEADARGINALFALMPLFEQFKANGKFVIDDLVASGLKINKIAIKVASNADSTVITPSAKLYDGSFDGSIRYERLNEGGRLKFAKTNIESVQLGDLLKDSNISEQLRGTGNLNIDVVVEQNANKQSSKGVIKMLVTDGAYTGVDIQKMLLKLNKAYSQYKGNDYEESGSESDETKFSSLSGTFNLKDNILTNDDFDMKAPLFRVGGAGLVNLDQETVDYTTKISVVNSIKGQGGESVDKLKGVTIPVRFTGPMASLKYSVDMKALAKSLLGDKVDQEKDAYLKRKLGIEGGSKASTKDLLKSALKKKYGNKEEPAAPPADSQPASNEDLNSNQQPAQQAEPPKTEKQRKKEEKDELKRKLLEKLLGG